MPIGPRDLPRWSTAPHVHWEGLAETHTPTQPFAVFVDTPGGPLDRIAHSPDVATFLNDRFHAIFLTPDHAGIPAGIRFARENGCLMAPPSQPRSPEAWIAEANAAVTSTDSLSWEGLEAAAPSHPLHQCLGD